MEIKIKTEYITLGQFIKFANLAGSGGDAKIFIQTTPIEVNGILTAQRGKKIYPGDKVKIKDKFYIISG